MSAYRAAGGNCARYAVGVIPEITTDWPGAKLLLAWRVATSFVVVQLAPVTAIEVLPVGSAIALPATTTPVVE